jgi:glycosyltransferase involved in cell wall biosynthesis
LTFTGAQPFGQTIIEAMAASLAVVGPDAGGSRDVFEHYSKDILFGVGDGQALAAQLRALTDDPALSRLPGQTGGSVLKPIV